MKKLIIIILFLTFFTSSHVSLGAPKVVANQVFIKGPTSALAPGSEFTVSVLVDVENPINAFDLEVTYEKDKLEFLNSDNTDSIVDIWQSPPSILPNGNIGFGGGILKAFHGERGLIIKLSFKALRPGEPKMTFVKNNLYIADGKGTEISASAVNFSLSVKESGKVVSTPTTPFKPTESDIIIKQELETFKSNLFWERISTPLLYFVGIIFVILVFTVYNKFRRKP